MWRTETFPSRLEKAPKEAKMRLELCCPQVCQFVEVLTHFILSKRQLYPEAIFVSRLAFGVPVKASIHPGVNKYIEDSLDGLLAALEAKLDGFHGVDVIIYDYDGDLVEKYAVRFGNLRLKPREKTFLADKMLNPNDFPEELCLLLRNSLLRLTARLDDLGPIENVKGCHFKFQIHADRDIVKAVQENQSDVAWEVDENNDVILDFIAKKIPVMNPKDNDFAFSLHIDLYDKDLQN